MNSIYRSSQGSTKATEKVEEKPKRPRDDAFKKVEEKNRSQKDPRADEVEEESGDEGKSLSPYELAKKSGSTRRDRDSGSSSDEQQNNGRETSKSIASVKAKKDSIAQASVKAQVMARGASSDVRSIAENQREMMNDDADATSAMDELSAVFTKGERAKSGSLTEQDVEMAGSKESLKLQEGKRRTVDEEIVSDKEAKGISAQDKIDKTKTSKQGQGGGEDSSGQQNAPFQMNIQQAAASAQAPKEAASAKPLQEIINQIVESFAVMRKGDLTETTLTLKNPPILSGATITLSTLDQAKGEFNITFASLSPEGKMFLDRQLSENPLTDAMKGKDIVVHQVITTTQTHHIAQTEQGQPSRDDQQQDQQQRQREQETSEEE